MRVSILKRLEMDLDKLVVLILGKITHWFCICKHLIMYKDLLLTLIYYIYHNPVG